MPIVVPYAVPPSYEVKGDTYGLIGASHALHHAKTARRLHVRFTAQAARHKSDSLSRRHAQERAEYYWDLEEQWTACATKTVQNARRRMDQERLDQRNLRRQEQEYGLACSPGSIQDAMRR